MSEAKPVKVKTANETQRREARKLLEAAARDQNAAIHTRYKKLEPKDPTEAEILSALRSGKIKLMPRNGSHCSCITIYTAIGKVIDFGQSKHDDSDNKEQREAEKKVDEAKRAAIGRVSLATLTAEELLATVEEFKAAKF